MLISLPFTFNDSDFVCPCCDADRISPDVIIALQAVRTRIGLPIFVTSGYRCHAHNSSPDVGGSKGSYHLKGLAVDIRVTPHLLHRLIRVVPFLFSGIGFYHDKRIIHLDLRPTPCVWVR